MSLIPFYKVASVMTAIILLLSGGGLTQTVTDGTAAAAHSLFHKQVKILHLDFIPQAAVNTDAGESVALSAPALVRVYQLPDNKALTLLPEKERINEKTFSI
ncbi:type VI secretion lipoprotein TssJ [Photorhabdus akhurstii]|uniref:type VI secretion lipoprotein TssJ n=1 Tax=Photorhabdus akhurstii TaxID=171438 RepID=UPI0011B0EF91